MQGELIEVEKKQNLARVEKKQNLASFDDIIIYQNDVYLTLEGNFVDRFDYHWLLYVGDAA